jgi:protein gp37
MGESRIEWTEATWNPLTGCSKVSSGCKNCYAERMAMRLQAMGQERYRAGFSLAMHEDVISKPLEWRSPRLIFVNSMSDLFHVDVPYDFIKSVFDVMRRASWHQFQILTKRAERLAELSDRLDWPSNVWIGVSVESAAYVGRIDCLRQVPASLRFLSLEPLLGPLPNLTLEGVHWVIVGGESGPRARPIEEDWVLDIQRQCERADVPFFFKQWGGVNKKRSGRLLRGRTWDALPIRRESGAAQLGR